MKTPLISLVSLTLLVSSGCAESKKVEKPAQAESYVNEASLPKGWPAPGPYRKVTKKDYPVYRVAVAESEGRTRAFWTLFRHIQSKDIPMTAPVEMKVEAQDGEIAMTSMGFLYQNPTVGQLGADGDKVEVTDVPALTAYSYAWMGPDNQQARSAAKKALEEHLAAQNETAESYRLLGYNGPSVPRSKRTYELQAILPAQ